MLYTFEFSRKKSGPQITWKWHISKYSKFKMMDFWQFQVGKTSVLAKYDQLQCQIEKKLHVILAGKFKCGQNQSKIDFLKNSAFT